MLISEPTGLEGMMKEDTAHLIIDLRDTKKAAERHIKGAVSIPSRELEAGRDRFPADKTAPIILVNETQASYEAFATVRGWGYANTSVLRGGMSAWKGDLQSGKLAAKIDYVKKLKPGEIASAEFKSFVQKRQANSIILDVREGLTEGRLPDALSIPHNELEVRVTEIPKEKEIIIHCNTGILAKMAYNELKDRGFKNVRYLNAVIQVARDGSYEITEK